MNWATPKNPILRPQNMLFQSQDKDDDGPMLAYVHPMAKHILINSPALSSDFDFNVSRKLIFNGAKINI